MELFFIANSDLDVVNKLLKKHSRNCYFHFSQRECEGLLKAQIDVEWISLRALIDVITIEGPVGYYENNR